MKKKDILEMPIEVFFNLKPSVRGGTYTVLREVYAEKNPKQERVIIIRVKDILHWKPRDIMETLSWRAPVRFNAKRGILKTLNKMVQQLTDVGFSKRQYAFMKSPYFVTLSSPKEEWRELWTSVHGLSSREAKKLESLLEKVGYAVPQKRNSLLIKA